jgi:hypothetical protein
MFFAWHFDPWKPMKDTTLPQNVWIQLLNTEVSHSRKTESSWGWFFSCLADKYVKNSGTNTWHCCIVLLQIHCHDMPSQCIHSILVLLLLRFCIFYLTVYVFGRSVDVSHNVCHTWYCACLGRPPTLRRSVCFVITSKQSEKSATEFSYIMHVYMNMNNVC